jgi:maltose alpha-D-glucosyltransferase/alpha-amylase
MKRGGSAADPLWYKDAIIYETHVKAFFDGDGDGIGDLAGLTQKLGYLQDLGITCLWLLPFFPSPLRDDGYDISDYNTVHPSYGTLEDFKALLDAAHGRGIQVMIELVLNHTSDQHPWFQRARRALPGSPERDFYVWSATDQKYAGARIIFSDSEKSNWTWDPEAKAYFWHRFFSHQPDLNFDNPLVLREMLAAMRFWLDLGVDGLRLDAIPYLIEREETNCENLPETHAVIREIRRTMDELYANRTILAEANQFPADVRPYFADGDECQMAFHFPLMPRIFMALRLEDRHPITEIMSQTPEIPDVCQWGLFLRNHDELTLEMVSDEERDYMYFAYSADPRMRLNVGIRRRLAPLVDNNRRRIELLNSLLLSFPGTPILYYGVEIGLGDNIYLGDRNGVRTPMQWSAERNAGFSTADPSRLYGPVIIDPVYGYEAVNVAAQQSNPSSLLAWTRNMIALRKIFRVFGRGTIEFLHPTNRKILAYLRRLENETVLCVCNLSRFVQPVELNLAALAGMIPIEMLGYSEFPVIGKDPYLLTVDAYGFYWFELREGAPVPEMQTVLAEMRDTPVLDAAGGWDRLLAGRERSRLEEVLLRFLPKQRWFGGKARRIETTRVLDWAKLTATPQAALILIEVTYGDDPSETYAVPMAIAKGDEGLELERVRPASVLCQVSIGESTGFMHDASFDDTFARALLATIEDARVLGTQHGTVRAFPTTAFNELRGGSGTLLSVGHGSAEQSNTSIVYGDRLILKLFRRLQPGPNPDFEIARFLTEDHRFDRVPRLAGAIEYHRPGHEPITLSMLQALVTHQGDGWGWTLEELGRYYELCASSDLGSRQSSLPPRSGSLIERSQAEIPQLAKEAIGLYLDVASTLGRRTAEMHLALSSAATDPAFVPEPVTRDDLSRLSSTLKARATRAVDLLKAHVSRLPDELVDQAGLVLSRRREFLWRFDKLATAEIDGVRIRIHGDYHLGQVLWTNNDFVIIDFEGEPSAPLAERRAKGFALKDVAGMLRSFSYAAYSGLLAYSSRRPDEADRLEAWASLWETWASASFLKAYRETAGAAAFLPGDAKELERFLAVYMLDKALYEMMYELNHRPAWLRVPLIGIISIPL